MKVIKFIFGILAAILGIAFLIYGGSVVVPPVLIWIAAIFFAIWGIVGLIMYFTKKDKSVWGIIFAILGLLLAIAILIELIANPISAIAIEAFLAWAMLIFLFISGIVTIIGGIVNGSGAGEIVVAIIMGILMILVACLLLNSILATVTAINVIFGVAVGIGIIVFGIRLIVDAFTKEEA